MLLSPLLKQLIEALRYLPGVGPKTAQRMALQLLERNRENGKQLARIMTDALEKISACQYCRNFSETDVCQLCASPHRDSSLLCIIENPIDLFAVEQMGNYRGRYFILMGRLSPLDGIGPDEIGIKQLGTLLNQSNPAVKEMILATNPTVEGEATAHYISEFTKQRHANIKITRIAHGVPLGGELEYIDSGTLAHAFAGRDIL